MSALRTLAAHARRRLFVAPDLDGLRFDRAAIDADLSSAFERGHGRPAPPAARRSA